jgi:ATP adenylyltransferase
MDYLWTPWRYQYVATIDQDQKGCIFCIGDSLDQDADRLVLYRGRFSFIILNLFPYTSGHVMISPYRHIADLSDCTPEQTAEMMLLAQKAKEAIEQTYHPDGFNIGMNLGRCAGAGVEHHLHLHVVPRWIGDANFMTVIGESRVLPDDLKATYWKLRARLET